MPDKIEPLSREERQQPSNIQLGDFDGYKSAVVR